MPAHFAAVLHAPTLDARAASAAARALEVLGAVVGPFTAPAAARDETRYAVLAAEVTLDGGQATAARNALAALGFSASLVPVEARSTGRRLLIMDVDSTLIQQEVIELLADYAGKREEVTAVTEAAMRGELDFAQSLHARVATLAGLPEDVIAKVRDAVVLSLGAEDLIEAFHAAGHVVCVVSGGFNQILTPLAERLGLDHWRANELEVVDGTLTGKVLGEVVDRGVKEQMLREWAGKHGIPLEQCIAVGDGANDLDMLGAAGLGIAFNAKPAVRAAADAAIDLPYLDVVRHLAGV
ncbi:phosphoserine phosphatase SerB [Sinomonas sp. ASV486]|uniref:phosphoserine phosphatase SerB n=1 Tax=Sinomonas sp. ASV486 TaxID=3051170 RepID=UPI0027DBDF37|nr:phosphoserine phosphatase SerB [Sinomonas sp. ASV486]MDQ4489555.1 phosphoserine phosphatase SerB [Sinomonas sp. ASV486]